DGRGCGAGQRRIDAEARLDLRPEGGQAALQGIDRANRGGGSAPEPGEELVAGQKRVAHTATASWRGITCSRPRSSGCWARWFFRFSTALLRVVPSPAAKSPRMVRSSVVAIT